MLLVALLNPVVVIVAFWLGRNANEWQKLPVAAFAAALGGWLLLYFLALFGWRPLHDVGRASAGILVTQFFVGLAWALLGYKLKGRRP